MEIYKNTAGNSGVLSYQMGPDYIVVKFRSSEEYVYTHKSAGKQHVTRMKALAEKGSGLSTYITRYVRELFDKEQ